MLLHKYQLNGQNIVLDVHSGAVHIVDELSYKILDLISPPMSEECPKEIINKLANDYTDGDIIESYSELYFLYNKGLLFSPDDYEKFSKNMVASPVKSMCLHIAHDCNLRCEYCFASTGDFGSGRKLMTAETGKKAIDFLLKSSIGRKNIELDFFGGEPLMNFEVVKEIVDYARSKEKEQGKNFRFTITTNGVLLNDDNIDYINKEMSNVVLSIDGRKSVNDKVRTRVDGSGCHDKIVEKFTDLVKKRGHKDYYVRGTFTKYNLDFSEDVMYLNELGFDQISVEPVVAPDNMPYAINESDLKAVFDEYEKLSLKLIDKNNKGEHFNFFHFMIDLEQGPCAIKRLRGCGCGNEYVAVTPDGDIYPCHQFVGMENFKMGNLDEGTFDFKMKDYFATTNIYNKTECKACWAKFYCSGGCNANNYQYAGDVMSPYKLGCEMQKKRLECAIMLKAVEAKNE